MAGTNASDSIFGWDFQINAAIILMLEDIENVQKVRVEGQTEDIEITMADGEFVFHKPKRYSIPPAQRMSGKSFLMVSELSIKPQSNPECAN